MSRLKISTHLLFVYLLPKKSIIASLLYFLTNIPPIIQITITPIKPHGCGKKYANIKLIPTLLNKIKNTLHILQYFHHLNNFPIRLFFIINICIFAKKIV